MQGKVDLQYKYKVTVRVLNYDWKTLIRIMAPRGIIMHNFYISNTYGIFC